VSDGGRVDGKKAVSSVVGDLDWVGLARRGRQVARRSLLSFGALLDELSFGSRLEMYGYTWGMGRKE
jgi:hypothetical protein